MFVQNVSLNFVCNNYKMILKFVQNIKTENLFR